MAKQRLRRKCLKRSKRHLFEQISAFKSQVLYLKHNLNARGIAALQHEFIEIAQLIQAMEKTIAEARSFVEVLSDRKALPTSGHVDNLDSLLYVD
ncbi:DUF2959 family protein [Methylomicrobium sp. Wu6]|uniref:DUF2959 family protein n=1 Tax=Methylomicrobium sp. Wu6 TaxID=3107928 RepID=UPI002DD67BE4|nr:DUF2959 family protein [Methylomicrobium sp. Wu6]MEC4746927.1 DUF2959 family protein [Methylomicrobium sp. Wu6]